MPVRFRFCGDDTVPDWVLTAINDLSYLDTNKLEHMVQCVAESLLNLNYTVENDGKLTLPEGFEDDKTYIAALVFILQSAIAYDVPECTLSNELQQVGLPHEHAIVLCKVYTEHVPALKIKSKQLSLRCSIPKEMSCVNNDNEEVILNLEAWQAKSNCEEKYKFSMSKEQVQLLIHDLNLVFEKIEKLQ